MNEHDQPQGEVNQAGEFWIDASVPDDEEVPDVLVGVTARESDALEHLHLLLLGQRRYKLADAVGELLLRIRERQAEALPPAEIREGIPAKTPSDPLEDLRLGPWEEDWERW